MGKYDEDMLRLHEQVAAEVRCYLDREGDEWAIVAELTRARAVLVDPVDDGWYDVSVVQIDSPGVYGFTEATVARQTNGDFVPRLVAMLVASDGES